MIYQASLTILFGPMTSVLFSLSSPALKTRLEDLYHQFFYAMVLVVVPVLVASIVYLRQGAALYEVTYIYYLTTMQFLALFGTALAGAVFNWDRKNSKTIDKKDKPEDDVTERIIFTGDDRGVLDALSFGAIVTVACILGFGLYLGSLKWIRDSTVSPDLARGLVSACEDYGSIVPAIPTTNINWQAVGLAFRPWRYEPDQDPNGKTHFIVSWVFLAPIVVVCCAIAIGFCVVGLAWVLGMIFLLLSFPFSNFFITLAFTIGTMYCLVHMQENRGMIRALAGPQFQDDRWGFGQVLAVFVWTPLSANLLLWLAGLAASFGKLFISKCSLRCRLTSYTNTASWLRVELYQDGFLPKDEAWGESAQRPGGHTAGESCFCCRSRIRSGTGINN